MSFDHFFFLFVYRLCQRGDLAFRLHCDLLRKIAARDRGGDLGDGTDLIRQISGHEVHRRRQIPPRTRHAGNLRLPAQRAFSADLARPPLVTPSAKDDRWSTIVLIVFFSSSISPFTSTVIFCERSPCATAVATSAMYRTWPVRLPAMALTESVRSYQIPETDGTAA